MVAGQHASQSTTLKEPAAYDVDPGVPLSEKADRAMLAYILVMGCGMLGVFVFLLLWDLLLALGCLVLSSWGLVGTCRTLSTETEKMNQEPIFVDRVYKLGYDDPSLVPNHAECVVFCERVYITGS